MPFVFRLSNLLKLDLQVSRGTDFEAWRTHWTAYINLSGLSEESAETNIFLAKCLQLSVTSGLPLSKRKMETSLYTPLRITSMATGTNPWSDMPYADNHNSQVKL